MIVCVGNVVAIVMVHIIMVGNLTALPSTAPSCALYGPSVCLAGERHNYILVGVICRFMNLYSINVCTLRDYFHQGIANPSTAALHACLYIHLSISCSHNTMF